ncbi:Kelch repeat-containing protein [Bacteroides uniformis]|uniref:Kelch repeat-containing protein n=1 Tax=Bacteroides uniformis TaxID=820 RepID=UPI001C036F14|nr:carboxypeptidase-like regulatory domain-containing protein [Bacteroides uniformis]MBT9919998.1 hypothetical protein [Bacteroides uniformis]
MKLVIVLFMILGCTVISKAQTNGIVIDGENGLPLANVNIYLQKDSVGIGVTDVNGSFQTESFNRNGINDTIVFSYIGYLPVRLTLGELKHLDYRVQMYVHSQQLSEVTIQSEYGRDFADYQSLKPLPRGVHSFASFIKDGKIYVLSGVETWVPSMPTPFRNLEYPSDRMFVYDIATDTWTKSPKRFIPRYCHAAVYDRGKVFIVGGKRLSTNHRLEYTEPRIEIYDIDKDTVYIDEVNPHQASDPITFIYGDCLYVMGGTTKKNKFSDKVHLLDLKTGIWYDTGMDIPKERRDNMKGVLVGDVVYLFGGESVASKWMIRSYNLKTAVWSDLTSLKKDVTCPGIAVNGHLIYIYEDAVLQIYNTQTDTVKDYYFTEGSNSSGLFYANGKIYIVGGYQQDDKSPIDNKNFSDNQSSAIESTSVFSVDVSHISLE